MISRVPMTPFDQELATQVDQLAALGLRRELRRIDSSQGTSLVAGGRTFRNFSSNDYLGLAGHPRLKDAAARAAVEFGAGSGASRLICGSLAPHHELEEALAQFKGTEAALAFSSGYAAAVGAIGAILGKEDFVIIDKLVHACVVDAARLCGAKLRVFAHNDLDELEGKLKWAAAKRAASVSLADSSGSMPKARSARILIVTESVFSMDGDLAPLREIIELKDKHGAWLMLDEAHSTGLFGEHRRGLAEACELADRVEIQMGTLGKALGAAGGYICGSRSLIDLLIHRARSFVFSTAPVPAAVAAARAAVELVQSSEGETLRQRLWQRVDETKNAVINAGWKLPPVQSPILPLVVGGEARAVEIADALRERGIFVPAIRYPTVARGAARLRLTVSAAHTPEDVQTLQAVLAACAARNSKPQT
jgi:8-amino-7-oxononanoate synthase